MASPSLKLGSAEFDEDTPRKPKKKPSVVKRVRKAAESGSEFYREKIAPRSRAILLVLAGGAAIAGASLVGSSFYESHQERKAETERATEEKQTPKASLKLKVKAKHDGRGNVANPSIDGFSPGDTDVDGCPSGTHQLSWKTESIEEVGQGIYKLTLVVQTNAHGSDLKYRFSFEIDDKDYDFMPVEATLVQ